MRRFRLFIVGALVLGALVPAVALAASSPTVETGAATKVATGSAVLTGTVNPNGAATGYTFDYGTSTALGAVTPSIRSLPCKMKCRCSIAPMPRKPDGQP